LDDFAATTATPTTTKTGTVDSKGRTHSGRHDDVEAAVENVQAALGVNPAGAFATVAARLTAIEVLLDVAVPAPSASPYGTSYTMDGIGNQVIGSSEGLRGALRFKAPKSGNVTAIRTWFKNASGGYGAGTGGTIRYSLQGDSSNKPNGTMITSGTVTGTAQVPIGTLSPDNRFDLRYFTAPGAIVAGNYYYIVFENLAADPVNNFLSINCTWTGAAWVTQPRDDLGAWHQTLGDTGNGAWTASANYHYAPILELTFDDGTHWGQGYMEPEVLNEGRINGTSYKVRERFTVTGSDKVVTGVALRLSRTSGTENLVATLQDSAGTTIDSTSIAISAVPIADPDVESMTGIYVSGAFSQARTLVVGQTYYIQFSTGTSTSLWTRGIQSGDIYGFTSGSHFSDGYAQQTTNGSTWTTVSGLDVYGDWQFYFTVT
jgi:hypothetical protein